jgi:hypothetical protein
MKLSAMKIDPALSEKGDWVENIPDLPGICIKARGANNSDYRVLEAAKLVREIPRARGRSLSSACLVRHRSGLIKRARCSASLIRNGRCRHCCRSSERQLAM